MNGKWLAETPIPADRPVYGTFVALADQTETQLHGLVEGLVAQPTRQPNTPAQQIGDLYQTFMDQAAIEKRGADPIRSRLAEIDAVRTPEELAALLGRLSLVDIPGPIGEAVNADVKDPTINVLYLDQAGTALPDRDYYLKDDAKFVQIRAKYVEYLTKVFTLVGRPRAAVDAKAVLDLETELARLQWTNVENRDPVKTYNRYTIARIRQEMPGFDWMAWAAPQGIDTQDHWVVAQPSFFVGFAALVPKTPLATWKAWLAAQVITSDARLLSTPFYDALFDFFGRTLSGTPAPRERWKRAIQLINGSMGEALGRLYVAKHFPPAAKARMQTMIDNLLEAYRQSIGSVDWMSPPTRQAALAKLDKFTSKIAYPNKWRDYTGLRIVPGDLVGDVERANRFESDYLLAKLGKPVDREEWEMTPQTVNAYYDPSKNQIVFPAAILQAPFFDMNGRRRVQLRRDRGRDRPRDRARIRR